MPARFPFLAASSSHGDALLMPLLPLDLSFKGGHVVQAVGLIDSGAAVNVLPYTLGVGLGAVWEQQTTHVTLSGNLATQEARAKLVQARVGSLTPVTLVFAWTRAENVPLLLGQVNFFDEFDVCIHRSQRHFEIEAVRK
jgi:hypothetical protein